MLEKIYVDLNKTKTGKIALVSFIIIFIIVAAIYYFWNSLPDRMKENVLTGKGLAGNTVQQQEEKIPIKESPTTGGTVATPKTTTSLPLAGSENEVKIPAVSQSVATAPEQKIHNNIITVKGVGILDMSIKNVPQRKYLARQAARADAKRQIVQTLETTVKSDTVVDKGRLVKDQTSISVAKVLRRATVISEKEPGNGTIEVTMQAPLNQ